MEEKRIKLVEVLFLDGGEPFNLAEWEMNGKPYMWFIAEETEEYILLNDLAYGYCRLIDLTEEPPADSKICRDMARAGQFIALGSYYEPDNGVYRTVAKEPKLKPILIEELSPSMLSEFGTIAESQCCDLKIDTGETRVWICRGDNQTITVERLINRKWKTVMGGHHG